MKRIAHLLLPRVSYLCVVLFFYRTASYSFWVYDHLFPDPSEGYAFAWCGTCTFGPAVSILDQLAPVAALGIGGIAYYMSGVSRVVVATLLSGFLIVTTITLVRFVMWGLDGVEDDSLSMVWWIL